MGRKQLEVRQGDKYSRWTIIKEVDKYVTPNGTYQRKFLCMCECGNTNEVFLKGLRNLTSQSCGCLKIDNLKKHGLKNHYLYGTWSKMINRCVNINNNAYKNYGERGIKVCDRWIESINNFIDDMGERPEGYTLDRINNDGNYEPSNCKWATRKEQTNNRRTTKKKEVQLV